MPGRAPRRCAGQRCWPGWAELVPITCWPMFTRPWEPPCRRWFWQGGCNGYWYAPSAMARKQLGLDNAPQARVGDGDFDQAHGIWRDGVNIVLGDRPAGGQRDIGGGPERPALHELGVAI